jgi:hypothetical protein
VGNARQRSVSKDVVVIAGRCLDCAHPTSALSMGELLEHQVAHDRRVHPEGRYLTDGTPAMRAQVTAKRVRIDTLQRAS